MADISVVIPAYNAEETIARAVRSALDQTLRPREVIVVDDGSLDATVRAVPTGHPRVRLIEHESNKGGSAARNTGWRAASGGWIAFLDADDVWRPEKLEMQAARAADVDVVYCDFARIRQFPVNVLMAWTGDLLENVIEAEREGGAELIPKFLDFTILLGGSSTLLVRRAAIEAISGWDERFARHQDWEFVFRLLKDGCRMGFVDEVLVDKHDTGRPAGDVAARAHRRFFEAFAEEVEAAERQGREVRARHVGVIAQCYLSEGRYREALPYLREARVDTLRNVALFVHAAGQGLGTIGFPGWKTRG